MPRRRKRRPAEPLHHHAGAHDRLYPTLDLHGETAESARRRAERWLRACQRDGEPVVQLVTGRGRRSPAGPVLRPEIEALLGALRREGVVEHATLVAAGGAFRVELARARPAALQQPPTPLAPAPSPPRDAAEAALRRQAEDALWELGITPSEALIRAELARLQAARERGG